MPKAQNDFYKRWVGTRIDATYTTTQTLDSTKENIICDPDTGAFSLTLPPTGGTAVLDGKIIAIQNKTTGIINDITLLPNATGGASIEGESSFVMQTDGQRVLLWLQGDTWIFLANTNPTLNLGGFHMHENAVITEIDFVDTNTDTEGTATALALNNNFSFATAPNALTYTGIKDITVQINIAAAISKANSSDKIYRILGIKNGSEIEGLNIATNILKAMLEVSITYPVILSTNDVIKVMIRNEADDEDVDVTDLVVMINEV
jgi:hypothetical protein